MTPRALAMLLAAACTATAACGEALEVAAVERPRPVRDTAQSAPRLAAAPDVRALVGTAYPLPAGIESLAAAVVGYRQGADTRFVYEHVRAGPEHWLLLAERYGWRAEGNGRAPLLRVIDVTRLPDADPYMRMELARCTDPAGGAAAAWLERVSPIGEARVRQAWRVDARALSLVQVDVGGVRCRER